jgi:hypothetical protein
VLIADYLLEDDLTGVDVIVGGREFALEVACVLITAFLHEALRESLNRLHGVIIIAKSVNFDRLCLSCQAFLEPTGMLLHVKHPVGADRGGRLIRHGRNQ